MHIRQVLEPITLDTETENAFYHIIWKDMDRNFCYLVMDCIRTNNYMWQFPHVKV
jgi:hypothetical protein